jgi:radical SAM superfamily enzyme YgiQ (UPF0313 family)
MKVLLAYLCHYQDRHDYFMSIIPVGLVSIAAYLEKQGFDVNLANFSQMGHRKALHKITELTPDVLGLSLFTHNRIDTFKLIKAVKKARPRTTITIGGPHATFLADEIIRRYSEVDYIISGEGERSFSRLLNRIAQEQTTDRKIISSELVADLDTLPPSGKNSGTLIGIEPQEQFSFIITSRGCPHQCVFCSSPRFWKRRVRYRSPEHIVQEIQFLNKKYGIIYFSIRDDNFTLCKERVLRFAKLLQDSQLYIMWNCQARVDTIDEEMLIAMKQAGLEHIQYGVESGSEKILRLYNKYSSIEKIKKAAAITRRVGVYLSVYLMTGMEGEGQGDTNKTRDLIKKICPHDGIVSPVALYPGTCLYEQVKKKGEIVDDIWFDKKESGVYLRTDRQVSQWMTELLLELERTKKLSRYCDKNFTLHRQVAGRVCWVTDILEGDYNFEEGKYKKAQECYQRILNNHPQNPWGSLRMKKLQKILSKKS